MNLKSWLLATRPKTLPIACIPILVGTLLAFNAEGRVNGVLVFCATLFALCIQVGTNLVNDALDFEKGSDTAERLGPQRMSQARLLSSNQVLKGGLFFFGLAVLGGMPLVVAGGLPLLALMLLSVFFGYIYTGGPWPLAYHGLGELFVFIFYGPVSICAVYYLQTGYIDLPSLVAGIQIGLLACVPIAINNLRDIQSDQKANKRTLAVRWGPQIARAEITFFILFPYLIGCYWMMKGNPLMGLCPLATLPLAFRNTTLIWHIEPSSQYNRFLAKSVLTMALFSISLLMGLYAY